MRRDDEREVAEAVPCQMVTMMVPILFLDSEEGIQSKSGMKLLVLSCSEIDCPLLMCGVGCVDGPKELAEGLFSDCWPHQSGYMDRCFSFLVGKCCLV